MVSLSLEIGSQLLWKTLLLKEEGSIYWKWCGVHPDMGVLLINNLILLRVAYWHSTGVAYCLFTGSALSKIRSSWGLSWAIALCARGYVCDYTRNVQLAVQNVRVVVQWSLHSSPWEAERYKRNEIEIRIYVSLRGSSYNTQSAVIILTTTACDDLRLRVTACDSDIWILNAFSGSFHGHHLLQVAYWHSTGVCLLLVYQECAIRNSFELSRICSWLHTKCGSSGDRYNSNFKGSLSNRSSILDLILNSREFSFIILFRFLERDGIRWKI